MQSQMLVRDYNVIHGKSLKLGKKKKKKKKKKSRRHFEIFFLVNRLHHFMQIAWNAKIGFTILCK